MMKLLLVDDSNISRNLMVQLLTPIQGVGAIASATTLYECWVLVKSFKPDLMVLDLHLTDGYAARLIPSFKQISPRMRIVVLTTDGSELARSQCAEAKVDWFMDKSDGLQSLVDVVRLEATSVPLGDVA